MSDRVLHILQHSLGVDKFGQGNQYRNHFVTGEGSVDHPTCMEAVQLGLMECRRKGYEIYGGDDVFAVTADGKQWVADNSPSPPKLTRGQKRYRDYLESDSILSFGEWMKRRVAA